MIYKLLLYINFIGSVSHQQKGSERSPIPPLHWIFPYSDVPPFYSNNGVPVSVIRFNPYNTPQMVQSNPCALFPQEPKYIPHQLSYPPGFYSQGTDLLYPTVHYINLLNKAIV